MTSVTVAVPTFRRPSDIAAALPLLLDQVVEAGAADTELRTTILVVDNDPAGSARSTVGAFGDAVRYVVEPQPGIAHARNRALAEAGSDLLVFLDDDERPRPGWLRALLATQREHAAAAVAGRVVSEFAAPLDPWIRDGGFFERRSLPTGTRIDVAATNNLLLDLRVLAAHGLYFDPDFGRTGGEDSLLTRRLAATGARLVWCDEAVVTDVVPAERTGRRWVLQRSRLYGVTAARVAVALADNRQGRVAARLSTVTAAAPRLLVGLLRWGFGRVVRSRTHEARGLRTLARGVGMIQGAAGHRHEQYGRP